MTIYTESGGSDATECGWWGVWMPHTRWTAIWTFHLKCHVVCLSVVLSCYRITCLGFCKKRFLCNKKGAYLCQTRYILARALITQWQVDLVMVLKELPFLPDDDDLPHELVSYFERHYIGGRKRSQGPSLRQRNWIHISRGTKTSA